MSTRVTRKQREERQEAIEHLRAILKPGHGVFGIVKHVSRSGMSRHIDFYTLGGRDAGCDRVYLSGYIATALDYRRTEQGALKVEGVGMNMIFSVVYQLGRALFPEGFGVACENGTTKGPLYWQAGYRPKTRQEAWQMVEAGAEFRGRNGNRSGWESDGGYALKAESL